MLYDPDKMKPEEKEELDQLCKRHAILQDQAFDACHNCKNQVISEVGPKHKALEAQIDEKFCEPPDPENPDYAEYEQLMTQYIDQMKLLDIQCDPCLLLVPLRTAIKTLEVEVWTKFGLNISGGSCHP